SNSSLKIEYRGHDRDHYSSNNNQQRDKDKDELSVQPILTISGTFIQIVGIGGESTGTGLMTKNGFVEVDLHKNGFDRYFEDGFKIALKGYYETRFGVETIWKVFVVTSISRPSAS